jgi:hypothetical protein
VTRFIQTAVLSIVMVSCIRAAVATPEWNRPEVWKLTVHARGVERPALRFALIPGASERTAGNAAPLYMMALSEVSKATETMVSNPAVASKLKDNHTDLHNYYLDLPLEKLSPDEVDGVLRPLDGTFQAFDAATHRDYCHWDFPIRELGFQTLLPHLNGARDLAQAACLRARSRVARRDYSGAAADMGGVFSLGHDLSQDGLLIQSLVGTGIAALGSDRVKEWVQQPDAPNLYWSLASLPRPFASLHDAMEWERTAMLATFPPLRKAESGEFGADDWKELFERLSRYPQLGLPPSRAPASAISSMTAAMAGTFFYPSAKEYLLRHGFSAEQVDSMPVAQALGRYLAGEYREWFDEMQKWSTLPYWQAVDGMTRTQLDYEQNAKSAARWVLASIPSVNRAAMQFAKLDRQVAALQTVEALRAYAAANGGALPAKLEDITDTPPAVDPMTGKLFTYSVQGNVATLESPARGPGTLPRDELRVEITFQK